MRLSHKNSVAASFIWKEERHMPYYTEKQIEHESWDHSYRRSGNEDDQGSCRQIQSKILSGTLYSHER